MKSKMMKVSAFFLSAFLLVYAGYQIWRFFYNPYSTEIAVNFSVSESLHVNGIAVRTETIIEDDYDGSISYVFQDAEKVLKNKILAYTHASNDTVNKIAILEDLEKELDLLKEANNNVSQLYGSSEYINTQLGSAVSDFSESITKNDLSGLSDVKNKLLLSLNKKNALVGNENHFDERIASLESDYNTLREQIDADASGTITSPKTGYFISEIDGFESLIDKESLFEKSVSEIEDIIKTEVVPMEQKIGKIADNYKWYYVISVSEDEAEMFKEGKTLKVNFDGINDTVELVVDSKISDETSENVVIVLLCKTFTSELASLRQVSADIIFNTLSGLRISNDSIRFDNQQNIGVYILDRQEVKFKTVDIIYSGNGYSIAKVNKGSNTALQLFDEVFVGGNDLYVGKVID